MLNKLHEVLKIQGGEIMALPFGRSNPDEVIDWLINLSDEEFAVLMKTPIINQAKSYYTKIRLEIREE